MKKLIGFTEEITTCGCCGKTDLKGTYQFNDGSFYGSECAKKVTNVSSELLKVAKLKSDYNLVAYHLDEKANELRALFATAKISDLKSIKEELKKIKEQYKIVAS